MHLSAIFPPWLSLEVVKRSKVLFVVSHSCLDRSDPCICCAEESSGWSQQKLRLVWRDRQGYQTSCRWGNFLYCCDRKARAASAQTVALWQKATVQIPRRDHSIMACSRHSRMGAILHAHLVRGELHIERRAGREVATVSALRFQRCGQRAVTATAAAELL